MKATGFSRVSKDLMIAEIEKELKARPFFLLANHGSISGAMMDKLRAKLRTAQARYLVVKNSLGAKAFEKTNLKELSADLSGACGIAFSSGDPALSSKILVDFAKENEAFKIQRGFMNGKPIGADQVKVLASLPSREVLLSKVLGQMNAPITGFVSVLSGTMRKIVTVLDAIAKKKK